MILTESFWISLGYSFFRVVSGYLLAMIIGTIIGVVMGLNQKADKLLRPGVSMLQTERIFAWTIILFLMGFLSSKLLKFLLKN